MWSLNISTEKKSFYMLYMYKNGEHIWDMNSVHIVKPSIWNYFVVLQNEYENFGKVTYVITWKALYVLYFLGKDIEKGLKWNWNSKGRSMDYFSFYW